MSGRFVVILAEDPTDAQALEHLLRHIVPDIGTVRKPRQPLVQVKGRPTKAVRSLAERIAEAVRREEVYIGRAVDLVIAHEDCDAVEPAHVANAARIETELRRRGVPNVVAATPAWEMEAWWYLWPEAVAAVCGGWRPLTRTGAVGRLKDVKEQLRRDLRPSGRTRVPDYSVTDAPRIAQQVRQQGKPPRTGVESGSYEAFRAAVVS